MFDHAHRIGKLESCCDELREMTRAHEAKKIKLEDRIERLAEVTEGYIDLFKQHDKREMEKYERIEAELSNIRRIMYFLFGIGTAIQVLYNMGVIDLGRIAHG